MGFAVVAEEVRNLAQRCAQAAKETSGKIEGAIAKTGQGVEITSKVATALNGIVAKVRQVDELITEVAGASREQTNDITQINASVGKMDQVTQSNAASAEESAAAAQEMSSQAEVLKQSVAELLKLVVGESEGGAVTPAPTYARRMSGAQKATPSMTGLAAVRHNGHSHPSSLLKGE
jgi:methyl-accepting chemotaxis protein